MASLEKFERGHLFRADTTDNEKILENQLANAWIAKFNSLPYGMRFYLQGSGEWHSTDNPGMEGFNKLHEFDAMCHENGWEIDSTEHVQDDYHPTITVTWRRMQSSYPF